MMLLSMSYIFYLRSGLVSRVYIPQDWTLGKVMRMLKPVRMERVS